jgi:hypothetical protein
VELVGAGYLLSATIMFAAGFTASRSLWSRQMHERKRIVRWGIVCSTAGTVLVGLVMGGLLAGGGALRLLLQFQP